MLQVAEEPWQKVWIEVEQRFIIPVDLVWHESKFDQKRVQKLNLFGFRARIWLLDISPQPLLSPKVALAGSVEDPLEASPLCSKVALADSVEDPLEAPCPARSRALPLQGGLARCP